MKFHFSLDVLIKVKKENIRASKISLERLRHDLGELTRKQGMVSATIHEIEEFIDAKKQEAQMAMAASLDYYHSCLKKEFLTLKETLGKVEGEHKKKHDAIMKLFQERKRLEKIREKRYIMWQKHHDADLF